MKIKVGKSYRTRDGQKVTVVRDDGTAVPFCLDNGEWRERNGRWDGAKDSNRDLVAKWQDDLPVTMQPDEREYTGSSVSYYTVRVPAPTSGGAPYDAECNDIIESLGLSYAEGNVLKAVWRIAAARQGKSKRGYDEARYDAEKIVFFGQRMVAQHAA